MIIPVYDKMKEIIKRTNNLLKKPQCEFIELVDNSYNTFVALPTCKYYTTHPIPDIVSQLQKTYKDDPAQYRKVLIKDAKKSASIYTNIYNHELNELKYTEKQLELKVPEYKYKDLNNTPFIFIDTVNALEDLGKILNSVTEFAVDLEHHSHRSLLGITCLMQISTRDADYIIDVLALRKQMNILWEPFANPNIVKVFHGADWDVKWLQRDFGIYVINMFDTGQAARVLGLGSFALSYLLKEICNVIANKEFQLSDWRVRPIPKNMLHYAREDTHYLLYIYDQLRIKLLALAKVRSQKNLTAYLLTVLNQSKDICLTTYHKPELKDYNYFIIISRHAASFSKVQISVPILLTQRA